MTMREPQDPDLDRVKVLVREVATLIVEDDADVVAAVLGGLLMRHAIAAAAPDLDKAIAAVDAIATDVRSELRVAWPDVQSLGAYGVQ